MINYNFDGLTRITKTKARSLYENGNAVLFIPCKLNPKSPWGLGMWEHKDHDGQYESFDALCNHYEYYNCNAETGSYIAFYVETETQKGSDNYA